MSFLGTLILDFFYLFSSNMFIMPPANGFKLADVTDDGFLKRVSNQRQKHPVYGTDAFEVEFTVPLLDAEARQAEHARELLGRLTGDVRLLYRSAFGQSASDMGHPDVTEFKVNSHKITGTTLLTYFDEQGEAFAATVAGLGIIKPTVRIGRLALLPHAAQVKYKALQSIIGTKLGLSAQATIRKDGTLLLPVEGPRYVFDEQARHPAVVTEMLEGSARTVLARHRREEPLPEVLHSGDFLVAGVKVDAPEHHVILDATTWVHDGISEIVHGNAAGLIAGRTVSHAGPRQVEIMKMKHSNGRPIPVRDVRVMAKVFRPRALEAAGI